MFNKPPATNTPYKTSNQCFGLFLEFLVMGIYLFILFTYIYQLDQEHELSSSKWTAEPHTLGTICWCAFVHGSTIPRNSEGSPWTHSQPQPFWLSCHGSLSATLNCLVIKSTRKNWMAQRTRTIFLCFSLDFQMARFLKSTLKTLAMFLSSQSHASFNNSKIISVLIFLSR